MTDTVIKSRESTNAQITIRRRRVPTILQQAAVECGAASLGMILAREGRWVSLDQLREDCDVTRDGSSAFDLVLAATRYGLIAKDHAVEVDELANVPMPAIIWWRRRHFMVLEGARRGYYRVNDPARGPYEISADEFAAGFSGFALTFTRGEHFAKAGRAFSPVRSLAHRLAHSRSGSIFALLTGFLAMLLGLVVAPVSQAFINQALGQGDRAIIPALAAALLMIGLLRAGLTLLEFGTIARLQAKFTLVGSASLVHRLMRVPVIFYLERSIGDLSQRASYTNQVAQLLASQMASAVIALIGAIGYAALLLYYNAVLGVIVLVLSLTNAVVLRAVQRHRVTVQGRLIRRLNELRGSTTSAISTIETVKSTGGEDEVFATLAGQQSEFVSAQSALAGSSALLSAVPVLLLSMTSATILTLGGYLTIQGEFTLGALFAVQALAMGLNWPVQTLMSTGSQLQTITANLQALDDVMDQAEDPRMSRVTVTDQGPAPEVEVNGSIALIDVTYGYSLHRPPLISNVSLELLPGQRIAVVGASGAGKSTLANLAAGLLQPWSGQVLYDGRPLLAYAPGAVEGSIAKVDQTIVLFEGTVRENVTLWDPTTPDAVIIEALEDAHILREVLGRRGGLDARVEENGRNFSGGQRQRLEIARALALQPRALILDEATNALDEIAEKHIDRALRRRGIATLIVAHRLSTVRDADEIVVLGRGGVMLERGSHSDLMAAGGAYARLVADDEGLGSG